MIAFCHEEERDHCVIFTGSFGQSQLNSLQLYDSKSSEPKERVDASHIRLIGKFLDPMRSDPSVVSKSFPVIPFCDSVYIIH